MNIKNLSSNTKKTAGFVGTALMIWGLNKIFDSQAPKIANKTRVLAGKFNKPVGTVKVMNNTGGEIIEG